MPSSWGREEHADLAVEKILDAAKKAFIERGVPRTGMATIADFAGCSRGTLYRYFKSRHELHLAYVNRAALEIVDRVRAATTAVRDPRDRLVECILSSVREVRRNPGTAVWFQPGSSEIAARMSRSSEIIETLTSEFASKLLGPRREDPEGRLLARWFVRVIVSLLAMPGESEAEERALVERFVAPVLPGAGGR